MMKACSWACHMGFWDILSRKDHLGNVQLTQVNLHDFSIMNVQPLTKHK